MRPLSPAQPGLDSPASASLRTRVVGSRAKLGNINGKPWPMRILFLATEWSSGHGGVSTFNRELACAVAGVPGIEVWCALPSRPPEAERRAAESAGVGLLWPHEQPAPPDSELFLLLCDMRGEEGEVELGELGFDSIVGHGRWTGPAALQLARRHGIPTRVHIVHVDPEAIEHLKDRSEPSGARSDELARVERDLLGGAGVLVFGVGPRLTEHFLRDGEGISSAEELLPGLTAGPLDNVGRKQRVLFVGRLEDGRLKGLDIALRELHQVARERTDRVVLELRGAANVIETEVEIQRQLADTCEQTTLEGPLCVHVKPFTVDSEHIDASFGNARLVIMPSREEGFGLVGLEAIARGRPVVMSRYSGLAQLVERVVGDGAERDILDAFLFDPDLTGALAEKIEAMFADTDQARERARRLRRLLEPQCDWSTSAHRLVERIRASSPTAPEGATGASVSSAHNQIDEGPLDSTPLVSESEEASEAHTSRFPEGLEAWPRDVAGRWIDRRERGHLRDELRKDARSPIFLLGAPGSGKSALLAQVAADLRGEGWHVVTVKADQVPPDLRSDSALMAWLGLPGDTPVRAVSELARTHERVAVIVDQLDALASLVDLHTARLTLLTRLLRAAATMPGVRVVASIRAFEASYDPELRTLQSPARHARPVTITLGPLHEAAVAALWREVVDASYEGPVPRHLLEPHTLKLAVRLRRPLESAAAVASAYWQEVRWAQPREAVDALFALVERLDGEESLWTTVESVHAAQLAPWVEAGVLLELRDAERGARFGFAHQTLHEQVRAHRWLEANDPSGLTDWVRAVYTTLNYRPKLLSILQRLRPEPRVHDDAWSRLWALGAARPSLRELLAVHLAQAETPSEWEARRMRDLLEHEPWLRGQVVQALAGREVWFEKLERWLAAEVQAEGGEWLAGYLGTTWGFAARTVDGWLAKWALNPQRRKAALWSLWQRPHDTWTDEGFRVLLRLAASPGVDEDDLSVVASQLERERLVALAVHLAAVRWTRSADAAEADPAPEDDPWHQGVDPYAAPGRFPWEKAAAADPVAFVTGLTPMMVRSTRLAACVGRMGTRFAADQHAWRHVSDHYYADHPLPAFFGALREAVNSSAAAQEIAQLAAVDNDALQSALVRAYQANVETNAGALVDFLLADRRRFLLSEIGYALQALGPHASDADHARVLAMIGTIERYVPGSPGSESDEREARVRRENDEYRARLRRLLAPPDPGDLESRDFLDELSGGSRGGIVQSPHSVAELTVMTDDELDHALLYYAGRDGWHDDYGTDSAETVGGNRQLCHELERWATSEPERAQWLLERRFDDVARGVEPSIDYRPAIRSLLVGLSASGAEHAEPTARLLDRTLALGLSDGGDDEAAEVRWAIASQVVLELADYGDVSSVALKHALVDWAGRDAAHDDLPPEPLAEEKAALQYRGGVVVVLPRGSFPALRALVRLTLGGERWDWQALLETFESLVEKADVTAWRTVLSLSYELHHVGPEYRERWLRWLDALFTAQPSVLAHPEGIYVLWLLRWVAPANAMQRWIELLWASEWPSGARVAAELTTELACIGPHEEWATERLDAMLADASQDAPTTLGVAHGLAFLLSDEHVRGRAVQWALEFARCAPPDRVSTMIRALRWGALRWGNGLFDLVDVLRERDIPSPNDRLRDLPETLLDAVELDPSRALDAARWLLEQLGAPTMAHESLVLLALQVIRQSDDEPMRVRGMELFEDLLKRGDPHARQAVRRMDGDRC